MIVRNRQDQWALIRQHDHALLAGQLLVHVGNRRFSPPVPLEPISLAVSQHDCAWGLHDDHPTVCQGRPRHVFEMPQDLSLKIWQESVDRVATLHPYAGLLVSLHTMALAAHASGGDGNGSPPPTRHQTFRSNQFLHRQIEIQENLRQQLGMRIDLPLRRGLAEAGRSGEEDLLRANFFLLEMLDQLSLVLCFDRLVFEKINPIFPRPAAGPAILHIEPFGESCYRLDPWPFDIDNLNLQIPARMIPDREYLDDADLQSAYAVSRPEDLRATLSRTSSGGQRFTPP